MREELWKVVFMDLFAEGVGRCWSKLVRSAMGWHIHTDEDVFEETWLRGGDIDKPATHREENVPVCVV